MENLENLENLEMEENQTIYEVTEENMFAFIKNGEIEYFGPLDDYNQNFEGLKIKKSELNFEKYNQGYSIFEENSEIIYKKTDRFEKVQKEKQEFLKNQEKQEKIKNLKDLKEKAEKLRLEYITAELLPEGENRKILLEKLEENRDIIAQKIDFMITEFRENFGEDILEILI